MTAFAAWSAWAHHESRSTVEAVNTAGEAGGGVEELGFDGVELVLYDEGSFADAPQALASIECG